MQERKYHAYTLHNYKQIPQIQALTKDQLEAIEVVGRVLPFKSNNYVVEELIDWNNIPDDPIFTLTFPRKMLPKHITMPYCRFCRQEPMKKQ